VKSQGTSICAAILLALAVHGETEAFRRLPLGRVQPEGWLRNQLALQAQGLTGQAETLYDDIGRSSWLTHAVTNNRAYTWERGPYYARGLFALAWTLGDATLKAKAMRWVEALLAWSRPNGDFGPVTNNWWANMPALFLLRDWHAATGDSRAVEMATRYARHLIATLAKHPLAGDKRDWTPWAAARGGDLVEILLDFNDAAPNPVFREAALLVASQTAPWTDYLNDGSPNPYYQEHIVNFCQGLKTPAQMWRLGVGEGRRHASAYAAAVGPDGWAFRWAGRPDAMLNGEEPLSGRSTTGGTELCAIAERIVSCADVISVFGDRSAADDMETVAYNALPAILSPDGRGMRYYLSLNCPKCTDERLGYNNNGDKRGSIVPGPNSGYACCRSNFHMAWPKFVQNMWMLDGTGAPVAIAYGPCRLETTCNGRRIQIRESGGYPFRDTVEFEFLSDVDGPLPLHLRVPGWCTNAQISVKGGKFVPAAAEKGFATVKAEWRKGDRFVLRLPCETIVQQGWRNESVCIRRGALLFAWPVPNERRERPGAHKGFPAVELLPKQDWNVALDWTPGAPLAARTVASDPIAAQPFTPETAPTRLVVRILRTDEVNWGRYRQDAPAFPHEPPPSPLRAAVAAEETALVPLGCTQTRITFFPWGSVARTAH